MILSQNRRELLLKLGRGKCRPRGKSSKAKHNIHNRQIFWGGVGTLSLASPPPNIIEDVICKSMDKNKSMGMNVSHMMTRSFTFHFKSSQEPADSCITTLEKCIQEIRSWMRQNVLKLNDEKTEFLLFGSRQQLSKVSLPFITIGDSQITPSSKARNLGVIFDTTMTLKAHNLSPTSFAYHHFISEILAE